MNNNWKLQQTLEGLGLVLGKGFDFDGLIVYDKDNGMLIIRSPYTSKEGDENYPYPNILELCVPIDQIKELIK